MVSFLVLVSVLKQRSEPKDEFADYSYKLDGKIIVNRDHLGLSFCPVCFGRNETVCEGILHNTVKILSKKETKSKKTWKPRAVGLWNTRRISIKHYGNASEFYKLDNEICSVIGKINSPCEVDVAWKSFLNVSSVDSSMKETMYCPSSRLMAKVKKIYFGDNVQNSQVRHNTLHLTSTLNLNQEPIIFQVFPSEKGWPFPKFYGACGRAIIMEDSGLPLDSFLSHSWLERAELALAVIKIAKQLTSNLDHWGLYITEIALDNFAVSNGTVRLEDASHILVVDLLQSNIKAEHKKTMDQCYRTDPHCLSSHPHELCQGVIRDQNYYAVCRGVLADRGSEKGLLHSPPEDEEFKMMLEDALTECINAQTIKRKEAIDLVVGLLQNKINTPAK